MSVLLLSVCRIFILAILLLSLAIDTQAQDKNQGIKQSNRERALKLIDESKHVEALKLLEQAAKDEPTNPEVIFDLGFIRYIVATTIKDKKKQQEERRLARSELLRAKQLGGSDRLLEVLLASIPEDGSNPIKFSKIAEAEEAMQEGEAAYARGELDNAIKAYQKALSIDPKLYEAALYIGDMYFKKGYPMQDGPEKNVLMANAGEMFAKAIILNPNRETAYRYWGSALLAIGKLDEAEEKVIEAYIAEPYNRLSPSGLINLAKLKNIQVGHPVIDIPIAASSDEENKIKINIDENLLKKQDGSNSWMHYSLTRAAWYTTKFAKMYPQEKSYRHSLKEEAEAIRSVIEDVRLQLKTGKIKELNPSLVKLSKLEQDGLLEAYILLARPDEGIIKDYEDYRTAHIDKLRLYVREYVLN